MKKIIATLVLVAGLVSCSSCAKPIDPVVPDSGSADAGLEVVIGDTWNFTLPNTGWRYEPVDGAQSLNVYKNDTVNNLIIFAKEPFVGTLQQYSLLSVRGIKDTGTLSIIVSQPFPINGLQFITVGAVKPDGNHFWVWVAVKNSIGYTFVCGGAETPDTSQAKLCEQIAGTIQIL